MNYNSKSIRKVIESSIDNFKVSYAHEQIVKDNVCCGYYRRKSNGFEVRNIGLKSRPLYCVWFYGDTIKEIAKACAAINREEGYMATVSGNTMTVKMVGEEFWQ